MAEQPLVLLAQSDRLFVEWLESVLLQGGYGVVRASARHDVVERARSDRPDAIILDLELDGTDDYGLCRALRADPKIPRAVPIILTTDRPTLRALQLDALRAGAWELRGQPLDTEDLLLRLGAYIQGKLEIDRLGAEGLVDPVSGMYNSAGVARRSEELAALTTRHGLPLACAVFRPSEPLRTAGAGDRLALAVKSAGRISDAVGRTGAEEFTVFAPATDRPAAQRLVARISESVARAMPVQLRAGISATQPASPLHPAVSPNELMQRARESLA